MKDSRGENKQGAVLLPSYTPKENTVFGETSIRFIISVQSYAKIRPFESPHT